jgi:hypothetical protein
MDPDCLRSLVALLWQRGEWQGLKMALQQYLADSGPGTGSGWLLCLREGPAAAAGCCNGVCMTGGWMMAQTALKVHAKLNQARCWGRGQCCGLRSLPLQSKLLPLPLPLLLHCCPWLPEATRDGGTKGLLEAPRLAP